MFNMRLTRRETPIRGGQILAFAVGLVGALALGAILLMVDGHNPIEIYKKMADSAFGSPQAWSTTLTQAVPLGLAGLAVAVAGSMGLWNIGAEGQIVAGAIAGTWVARLGPDLPGPALITLMLVASVVGGGLLALGPALARAHLGVNEIITTLMLNEIAIRIVRYLVNGPWKDPTAVGFPVAPELPEQSALPILFERANIGVLIAAFVLLAFGFFASRSKWGYELRVAGSSAEAAEYVGISLRTKILTVLVLSGAIAGLAGGIRLGTTSRIVEGIAEGWGFAGIIVAALALMRPSGVAAVAVAFGALRVGSVAIKGEGVPASIADIIQALVLIGALTAGVFTTYRITRSSTSKEVSTT
jgi:ABC-type uncharacterized transport system permease subunit